MIGAAEAGGWKFSHHIRPGAEAVRALDSQEDMLAMGTARYIKVINLQSREEVVSLGDGAGGLVLAFVPSSSSSPFSSCFILTVGEGCGWEGLKVWSLETQELVRHVKLYGRMFEHIASNGNQVAIMETLDIDSDEDNFVFVYDIKELCYGKIPADKVWRRVRIYEKGSAREARVSMNTTCLLLSHGANVNIQNFWNSQ